ncbi:hypothetical protein, partial [Klebsiella pneumoniae]|uniref:hypothetical protein n=1 Tax=Klebsiella pneumoniae TaxID=573 RepID=UPI003B98535C
TKPQDDYDEVTPMDDWRDIHAGIVLGSYHVESVAVAIEIVSKQFGIDSSMIRAHELVTPEPAVDLGIKEEVIKLVCDTDAGFYTEEERTAVIMRIDDIVESFKKSYGKYIEDLHKEHLCHWLRTNRCTNCGEDG